MTSTEDSKNSKQEIRRRIRTERNTLTQDEIFDAAVSLNHHLWSLPQLSRATRIATYIGINGEADCSEIIRSAWQRQKQTYVPILRKNRMLFANLSADKKLKNNRFGIPEPEYRITDLLKPANLDVVLMPLVAFDGNGNRLGMGGGFYDRSLQQLQHRKVFRHPLLIGMAYDFQRVGHISAENWDIPLDAVITETGVSSFSF